MKPLVVVALSLVASYVFAQSNFDPLVVDQIRQMKEQQEQLKRQHDELALQLGVRPTPPPTDAGKVWRNEKTGATRVDRLSPDYERNRAAALAKYEQDLARWNTAQQAKRENEARQQELQRQFEQRQVPAQPVQQTAVDRTLASRMLAAQRYPALLDPNSEFTRKYLEIGERLRAAGSPILRDSNSAERIADLTAGEMKVLPVK